MDKACARAGKQKCASSELPGRQRQHQEGRDTCRLRVEIPVTPGFREELAGVCCGHSVLPRSLGIPLPSSPYACPAAVPFAANAGTCTFWKIVLGSGATLPPKELEGSGSSMPFPQAAPSQGQVWEYRGSTPQVQKLSRGSG